MKHVVLFMMVVASLTCCTMQGGNMERKDITKDAYLQSLDSTVRNKSLISWTSDTAFATNPELMILLDTLYQHVREDSFPTEVTAEEKWMTDYQKSLCAYYDSHSLGSDTIPDYAKADSVLNEGLRLLELGSHWSTMEMIVYNSTEYTFDRCREYGLLAQVVGSCETDEAKNLVRQEWALYEQMLAKIGPIASNIVRLNYWGGSISGPLGTGSHLQVINARIRMYKTILSIIEGREWDDDGVPLPNAERLLFDCCTSAIEGIEKEHSENEVMVSADDFRDTVHEVKMAIEELRPIVRKWVTQMDKVDEEFSPDGSRHTVERAASSMLMKWASIVTQ